MIECRSLVFAHRATHVISAVFVLKQWFQLEFNVDCYPNLATDSQGFKVDKTIDYCFSEVHGQCVGIWGRGG